MTTQQIDKIIAAIRERRRNYTSDSAMAKFIGINTAQYSRIMKGDTEQVVSTAKWTDIAHKLGVVLNESVSVWNTATTKVYKHITAQLRALQRTGMSAIFCDMAGIGKTHAAKVYVQQNANAVYIDCSQHKTKRELIKAIAQAFGVDTKGKYNEINKSVIRHIKSLDTPLVVLDEAGDLSYEAFLELKALWNATEYACGWYMMGADGLRAKIDRMLEARKVGYAEIFRRYGNRFQDCVPVSKSERIEFLNEQVAAVALANGVEKSELQKFVVKTGGDLSRAYFEIQKTKIVNNVNGN